MDWESIGLFATPLIKVRLTEAQKTAAYFHSQIASAEKAEANIQGSPEQNALSHFSGGRHALTEYAALTGLRSSIEQAASFAYRDLLNYKKRGSLKVTNSWFNLAQPGATQGKHSHANALLCGTFYVHTDARTCVEFYHPQTRGSSHAELYDRPDESVKNDHGLRYHHPQVSVRVSAGDCLFWPAHLEHGYENNQTPNRLSLSFNLMPTHLNCHYEPYISAS